MKFGADIYDASSNISHKATIRSIIVCLVSDQIPAKLKQNHSELKQGEIDLRAFIEKVGLLPSHVLWIYLIQN